MAFELIYTSAPAGIDPGSSGFCTVAATRGIPRSLIRLLESLTAYNPVFAHYTPEAGKNPVANFHCLIDSYHIFARLHGAGLDYTGRSNKFADFLIFSDEELRRADVTAADVFRITPSPFRSEWNRSPEPNLPQPPIPVADVNRTDPAYVWQQCCGDAAYAAVPAYYALSSPNTPIHILFDPLRMPTAECTGKLAAESVALLEDENARRVTFHSCFTQNAPPGITFQWRFVPVQSEMASKVRNNSRLIVFDLAQMQTLLQNPDPRFARLVERARSGKIDMPVQPRPPAAPLWSEVSGANGKPVQFEYDDEAPLFKIQPKRPRPPEADEKTAAIGTAVSARRGGMVFFILGLIVFITVVMGAVVLFNTPRENLQKIWDPWKRLESAGTAAQDIDLIEGKPDNPGIATPQATEPQPGQGAPLPEAAQESAVQPQEMEKTKPRSLTAEVSPDIPGAAVRKADAAQVAAEKANDGEKISYSDLLEKLNWFSAALEGKDGTEKLTVLNEAIAFATQAQFKEIWAPEEEALLRKWNTEYTELRYITFRRIAQRVAPQAFKDVEEAQQAQQTLQELQEFDRKFPPQTGTAGVEQKFKAACNVLGRKLHQDIWNLLQKDAENPASLEQCEALLKEAEAFNQAFPAVKPQIPVEDLRNGLENIRQAREAKKQQLEKQLKKTPLPESLPAKIVLLPPSIQIRVQLCDLPEGYTFTQNGQAVRKNDREIIFMYPAEGFFRYKTELDKAVERFKETGKMSSNPKRVLNQAIDDYNKECDQTNKNLAAWLSGKVKIKIPFEDQLWNVQINFEPIKKESAVP